jgi:hypothetical protein
VKAGRRRLISAALLLAVAGVGLWFALRAATGANFVAGALSQLLDARVEVDGVSLELGAAIDLELSGIRVYPHGAVEPTFQAERARTRRSWPQILAGRFAPKRWELSRPVLIIEAPAGGGRSDALDSVPPIDLSVTDGTVIWRRPGAESLFLERLRIEAEQPLLRSRVEGTAAGTARLGERDIGSFSLEFQGWLDEARLQGSVNGVDLAVLPRGSLPRPRGRAGGRVTLFYEPGSLAGTVDLQVEGFRLRLPDLHGPIAPREMRVAGEVSWSDGTLKLRPDPLKLDDFSLSGDLEIDTRPEGRIRGWVAVERFELGVRPWRLQLLRLGGLRFASWRDVDRRTEAGFMEDVRLDIDAPRSELTDVLGFRERVTPEQIRIRGRVRDAIYRPRPDSIPLEGIDADVRIDGNVLRVENLQIFRGGEPLPRIDVTLDGMHRLVRLPKAERVVPRGPGVPIPGLGPTFSSFGPREPGRPETTLRLVDFDLGHPAFLLPLRDAEVELSFPEGRLRVDSAHGVFGGVPAEITGVWDYRAETVHAHIVYADDEAEPPGPRPLAWAVGEFETPTLYLGDWLLEQARGRLRVRGADVEAREITAAMHGGKVEATAKLSLAEPDHGPYRIELEVSGCDAEQTGPVIGIERGDVTGTVNAQGTLEGKLHPDRLFLDDAVVRLVVGVRDGELGNTPFTLTLARLATPLGWTGLFGRALRFDDLDTRVDIEDGLLFLRDFTVEGPELRMLMAGEMDLLSEDLRTDVVVALLFLESVDTIVEKVPLVGRWMLGDDRSLVTAYFRLQGPRDDLDGTYVPPQTVRTATGWAGNLVGGGVKRVLDVLTLGASRSDGSTPPPPPKPQSGTPDPDVDAEPQTRDEDAPTEPEPAPSQTPSNADAEPRSGSRDEE